MKHEDAEKGSLRAAEQLMPSQMAIIIGMSEDVAENNINQHKIALYMLKAAIANIEENGVHDNPAFAGVYRLTTYGHSKEIIASIKVEFSRANCLWEK